MIKNDRMKRLVGCLFLAIVVNTLSYANDTALMQLPKKEKIDENAGLILPVGFRAFTIADSVGKARHIVATAKGDLYVKLDRLVNNKGILRLRDTDGDGKADDIKSFGGYRGTGITNKDGYLYVSSNDEVFRYNLDKDGEVINPESPERIIKGLVNGRQHNTKSIVLDDKGNIYVNIGAPSNSCQEQDRGKGSKRKRSLPHIGYGGRYMAIQS